MNDERPRRAAEPALNMCEACTDDCAICLAETRDVIVLACSHRFCREPCLKTYVDSKRHARRVVTCPICATKLCSSEVKQILLSPDESLTDRPDIAEVLSQLDSVAAVPDTQEVVRSPRINGNAERAFAKWAIKNHIKRCPGCSSPIQKTGGCDHMRCGSCQLNFRWQSVPIAAPCSGWHYRKRFPFVAKCPQDCWRYCPTSGKVKYYLHISCVYLPIAVTVLPVSLAIVPPLWATKRIKRAVKAAALARSIRRAEKSQAAMRAAEDAQIEATLCRNTQKHEWVAGWCGRCGATNDDWLAWEQGPSLQSTDM